MRFDVGDEVEVHDGLQRVFGQGRGIVEYASDYHCEVRTEDGSLMTYPVSALSLW